MKVALVHDWLNQYGGAERVLEDFHTLYPEAPVFVSMYDRERMPAEYRDWDIRTTWMQRLPLVKKKHQPFMPLYPIAFESFDLSGYDVVLSSSSAFCHGVLTRAETCHVCYCHTPTRFMWDYFHYVKRENLGRMTQRALAPILFRLRPWDKAAADRVDYWMANSRVVQQRIAKFYRRSSTVIHPPVNTTRFQPASGHDDYYLVLSRLIGYKRIDLAVEACTRLGKRLIVAGSGRDAESLKRLAGPTVEFVGRVNDEQMRTLYARCKAFLFPGEEDFGITPLEAMASGRPVIAYGAGGALDTVIPGVTGSFFIEPTVDSLAAALTAFDPDVYDPAAIRAHAEGFDSALFRQRIQDFVEQSVARYRAGVPTFE
ncbi:MAG TPA: glycosyltransferase [Armatimonadota bacterium]|jgi:glycosyltransferase involved in cell wall biosynthesis